jgi:hypothetical protein
MIAVESAFRSGSAAIRRAPADRGVVFFSIVGLSAPASPQASCSSTCSRFDWAGSRRSARRRPHRPLQHLALPAVALALTATGLVVKITRCVRRRAREGLRGPREPVDARAASCSDSSCGTPHVDRRRGLILAYARRSVLVEVTFVLPIGALLVDSATARTFRWCGARRRRRRRRPRNLVVDLLFR